MDMEQAAKERMTHPLMDQYFEPHPLPDRIDVAYSIFRAWTRMIEFEEKVIATGKELESIGLVTARGPGMGVPAYTLKKSFLEVFGIWVSSKTLDVVMEDVRRAKFYSKERPNPFTELCDLLYEIRAHALDNPMMTIAERCGGDPLDKELTTHE